MQVPTYLPCVLSLRQRLRGLIGIGLLLAAKGMPNSDRRHRPRPLTVDFVLRASGPPFPAGASCGKAPGTTPATPALDRRRRPPNPFAAESARSIAGKRPRRRRRSSVAPPPTIPPPTHRPTPGRRTNSGDPRELASVTSAFTPSGMVDASASTDSSRLR